MKCARLTLFATVLACLLDPLAAPAATPKPVDRELAAAIHLVEGGEYRAGQRGLDEVLVRLQRGGTASDRALAHFYAGVALVAQGLTVPARDRFRRALAEKPDLELSAEQFPPKVTELLASTRAARAAAPAPAVPRLLRTASGVTGTMAGPLFSVTEPRTAFRVPDDRQVVVSFDWEAPPGTHRLQASWIDPAGQPHPQPPVVLEGSGRPLSAYWVLALPADLAPGRWTLEVSTGGQLVGQHAIEVAGPRAVRSEAHVEAGDVYARVRPSMVVLEKRDAQGGVFGRGLGFVIAPDRVATAFQAVDGAQVVAVTFHDGRKAASDSVAAWSRWDDWAVLVVAGATAPTLRLSGEKPGDGPSHVFDVDGEGRPYLARPVTVLPAPAQGRSRERLVLGVRGGATDAGFRLVLADEAAGGPVVDPAGQVVGIVGGSLVPGESTGQGLLAGHASLATPVTLVSSGAAPPVRLAELIARGESLAPLPPGELTRVSLSRAGPGAEETNEISRADPGLGISVVVKPVRSRKATLRARVYDLDGGLLVEGEPRRADLSAGRAETSAWQLDVSRLLPGAYRIEVLVDADAHWRGYFRLSE